MTHPFFAGARHPRILAHRGLASAPGGDSSVWENTAAAFAAAHATGIEFIESDCQVTADGEVVFFHDETLERIAGDPRRVSDVRLRELSRLFEDHGGLMRVAEALDAFPESRFNIDVKTGAATEPIGRILAPHAHRVLVTGFSDRVRIAALDSVMRAGARVRPATSGGRSVIARLRALSALHLPAASILRDVQAVQIPTRYGAVHVFTPSLVRAAHAAGAEVHVWTINDADEMRRLAAAGADGIITDRADIAAQTLL